MITGH